MERLGKRFPGAILCFATLNKELTPEEKKGISRLARKGRQSLRTGQQLNPVLVLTGAELLGRGARVGWQNAFLNASDNMFPVCSCGVTFREYATLLCRLTSEWNQSTNGGSRKRNDGGQRLRNASPPILQASRAERRRIERTAIACPTIAGPAREATQRNLEGMLGRIGRRCQRASRRSPLRPHRG